MRISDWSSDVCSSDLRIEEYCEEFKTATFTPGKTPWGVPCDVALPCATQNELLGDDAKMHVKNGCIAVSEGANMPTNLDGVHIFTEIGSAHVRTPVTNAHLVCLLLLEKKNGNAKY